MPFLLSADTIRRLNNALVPAGLATPDARDELLQGIHPGYAAALTRRSSSLDQVQSDLAEMNQVPALDDGQVPLRLWLENAAARLKRSGRAEAALFEGALAELISGGRATPPPDAVPSSSAATTPPAGTPPPAGAGISYLFLSYSRTDRDYVRRLAADLQAHGFAVWFDDQIDLGERWWPTVVQAIYGCVAVVVVMSPEAEASTWVEREILLAQRENKAILPLLLRGNGLPLLINQQYADVRGGQLPPETFYTRLQRAVARAASGQPGAGTPAATGTAPATSTPDIELPPPAAPAITTVQKRELVQALLTCAVVADRQSRASIVDELPPGIRFNIRRSDRDREDVNSIVTAALNYPDGLPRLIEAVRFFEGDSLAMQAVDRLLADWGVGTVSATAAPSRVTTPPPTAGDQTMAGAGLATAGQVIAPAVEVPVAPASVEPPDTAAKATRPEPAMQTPPIPRPAQTTPPPTAPRRIPAWVWVAAGAVVVVLVMLGVLNGPWWPLGTATPTLALPIAGSPGTSTPAPPTVASTAQATQLSTPTSEPATWQPPTSPIAFDWVEIPAGEFTMGSDPKQDSLTSDSEQPPRSEFVDTFWIARTEVTVAQFAAFVEATGYQTTAEKAGEADTWQTPAGSGSSVDARQDHPVTHISWIDALAFSQWAGVRLPTEAEWEKACRGAEDSRIYPWGSEPPDDSRANYKMNVGDTTPVGSYPAGKSPYGLLDMSGNVWEWTQMKWRSNYDIPADNSPQGDAARVVRGGAFDVDGRGVRCAFRYFGKPDFRSDRYGFRVCAVIRQE